MLTRKRRIRSSQTPVGHDRIGPVFAVNSNGVAVCGSRRKGRGENDLCMSTARCSPSGRCNDHGGGRGSGRAISTGLYSQNLPSYLRAAYEESLGDPNIGAMQDSIALMDAFIANYLKGLLKVPPVDTIREVASELRNDIPLMLGELEGEFEVMSRLEVLIASCADRLTTVAQNRSEEQEIRKAVRERAELVKVEAMRIDKASKYVTVEQAMALIAALVTIINRHVSSETERVLISRAIDCLISKGAGQGDQSPRGGDQEPEIISSTGQTEATST